MVNDFLYFQPLKIKFGAGVAMQMQALVEENGYKKGILICDKFFLTNGLVEKIMKATPSLKVVYSDITPNPLLSEVTKASNLIKENGIDFAIALGGGSSMDLAKFACALATAEYSAEDYFYKRQDFVNAPIPLFAMPTTAGTGSEVTSVSVCNDDVTGTKAPLACPKFFAKYAVVDPELTVGLPKYQTAITGLDAFCHAIEAYWSMQRQPICDMFAIEASKHILGAIEDAYANGSDINARTEMSYGSLLAGLAFTLTRTASIHGCSYPLSIDYHLPHGEACAYTLDKFVRVNGKAEPERMNYFAKAVGFEDYDKLADKLLELKKAFNLKITLEDLGCTDVEKLAKDCAVHPLCHNNPVILTAEEMKALFLS